MKTKLILIGALGLLWIFGAPVQAQPLAQYTFNDGTPKDIGIASNALAPTYVALNGSETVFYNDPAATQIEEWTEWPIELQEFADQGVVLTNVNTISIGFGDKNAPQVASGLVFIDDIRLYPPPPPAPAPEQ